MKIIDFIPPYLVVARTGPYVGSSKLDPYVFQQSRYKLQTRPQGLRVTKLHKEYVFAAWSSAASTKDS